MKTNIYYRLGIIAMIAMIAMCIMTIYEIVDYAISMEILDDPEIYGDNRLLYYPISVLTIASIAGLVLYIRKKVLGWILCCGYSVFMFVTTFIGYYAFQQIGINLGESTSDLLTPAIIQGTLYAAAVWLFFTRQIRFSFFDSEQAKLSDAIPVVIVAALAIGSRLYAYSGGISENPLCGYSFRHNVTCLKIGYKPEQIVFKPLNTHDVWKLTERNLKKAMLIEKNFPTP